MVITGATSGIGKATALRVAALGGTVILVARGAEKLEETKSDIEAQGGIAFAYPCDLTDLDAIDKLAKKIAREHETVDFVVNNAGRSIRRSLRLSYDRFHDLERTMQLNYFGAIRLIMGLTPMIAPTKIYDAFPTISPAQAADLILKAMRHKPHEINTLIGTAGEMSHSVAPNTAFRVLHQAYKIFPDSAAARGEGAGESVSRQQKALASVLKGVHW